MSNQQSQWKEEDKLFFNRNCLKQRMTQHFIALCHSAVCNSTTCKLGWFSHYLPLGILFIIRLSSGSTTLAHLYALDSSALSLLVRSVTLLVMWYNEKTEWTVLCWADLIVCYGFGVMIQVVLKQVNIMNMIIRCIPNNALIHHLYFDHLRIKKESCCKRKWSGIFKNLITL